jgi:hypothetical protein
MSIKIFALLFSHAGSLDTVEVPSSILRTVEARMNQGAVELEYELSLFLVWR